VVKGSLSEVFITDMPVKTREEAKRSQAAETKATDQSAKSIMSEMLAEQSRWYQAKESSTHQQVQEWLRGGDAPPRIFGDSNGRPIRANISESALERRALGVQSTRKTAVAVVQDAKSRMWFIVSLPVTSLDPYTFVADSPFAHSDDYEVWRRYPYVGSTTIMDALASQYLRAWSKENPNESPPPESAVLATGPRADDPKATEESQASSTTPTRRYYNGDKGRCAQGRRDHAAGVGYPAGVSRSAVGTGPGLQRGCGHGEQRTDMDGADDGQCGEWGVGTLLPTGVSLW
jgi:hypothetical protein